VNGIISLLKPESFSRRLMSGVGQGFDPAAGLLALPRDGLPRS
jgi:hypothetical protein